MSHPKRVLNKTHWYSEVCIRDDEANRQHVGDALRSLNVWPQDVVKALVATLRAVPGGFEQARAGTPGTSRVCSVTTAVRLACCGEPVPAGQRDQPAQVAVAVDQSRASSGAGSTRAGNLEAALCHQPHRIERPSLGG